MGYQHVVEPVYLLVPFFSLDPFSWPLRYDNPGDPLDGFLKAEVAL